MSCFGAVAARSCASHEGLALALAEDLGCDTAGAPEAIRRLAAALPRDPEPEAALQAVSDLCRYRLKVRVGGALLLPEVLRRGGGDPFGVAVVAAVALQLPLEDASRAVAARTTRGCSAGSTEAVRPRYEVSTIFCGALPATAASSCGVSRSST